MSKRLFPEEKVCYDAAARLMQLGPSKYMVNSQGKTIKWPRRPRNVQMINWLYTKAPVIYVNADGWTLATPRRWSRQAALLYGQWVGIIEIKCASILGAQKQSGFSYVGELNVIPDSGPSYLAGYVNGKGNRIAISAVFEDQQEDDVSKFAGPMTLDDLRDWMKTGCPIVR